MVALVALRHRHAADAGVIGLGLRRRWNAADAWFCSELVEAAAAAGGRCRFVNDARRVTPQHSWMVA